MAEQLQRAVSRSMPLPWAGSAVRYTTGEAQRWQCRDEPARASAAENTYPSARPFVNRLSWKYVKLLVWTKPNSGWLDSTKANRTGRGLTADLTATQADPTTD